MPVRIENSSNCKQANNLGNACPGTGIFCLAKSRSIENLLNAKKRYELSGHMPVTLNLNGLRLIRFYPSPNRKI